MFGIADSLYECRRLLFDVVDELTSDVRDYCIDCKGAVKDILDEHKDERVIMDEKTQKLLVRFLADYGVRSSYLDDLHAGEVLPKKYRDKKYSRITDREMRRLMLNIERGLLRAIRIVMNSSNHSDISLSKFFVEALEGAYKAGVSWDDRLLD